MITRTRTRRSGSRAAYIRGNDHRGSFGHDATLPDRPNQKATTYNGTNPSQGRNRQG